MTEEFELLNQGKIGTLREKETWKYMEILEADTIKQEEVKKKFKRIPQENNKITRNQSTKLKSHQRDKHQDCIPR